MTALYGYKWTNVNGEEFEERSHLGQVWLAKTENLAEDQWFKAIDRCEKEVRAKAKCGDECWPPSYEEFLVYATEQNDRAHKLFVPRLPESKEAREERKAKGREHVADLRARLFG